MSAPEKQHITQALQFELGRVKSTDVQQRMVDHLANIDEQLATDVPGGADSIAALTSNADAVHFVQEAFKHYKPIGAAGEGANFLDKAAIKADDPGVVVADTGAAAADPFMVAIGKHRFWDRKRADLMPA